MIVKRAQLRFPDAVRHSLVIPGRALRADPESSGIECVWIPGSPAKGAGAPE
jgi:hypothetical protein